MGASSSKIEEDKALQLCGERKKFVKQALDGRCTLAASHVAYIQSLRSIGAALQKFVEPEIPTESSLCTSNSATPEALALAAKSPSQFSFSSPTLLQRVDPAETFSPSPSPPSRSRFQANHMKFRGSFSNKVEEKPVSPVIKTITSLTVPENVNQAPTLSHQGDLSGTMSPCLSPPHKLQANHMNFIGSFSKRVEEKPSLPVTGTVTSSSTLQDATPRSTPDTSPFGTDRVEHGNEPWDYFFQSSESQVPFQGSRRPNQQMENADEFRRFREDEEVPELEEHDNYSISTKDDSFESEDEFDEPSTDTLVRSFQNLNRAEDHVKASMSTNIPSAEGEALEEELSNKKKASFPNSLPLRTKSSVDTTPTGINRTQAKEDVTENKLASEDFFSSMKYVEYLFNRASESGKEVPRMLEANKLHFRLIAPRTEGGSRTSTMLKACFSCGEDPDDVPEGKEPAQTTMKYLTWHRTASSLSSSSRIPLGPNSKVDAEDLSSDLFENFCMISGSHASTLDRLYAWERKLYDEVKVSKVVRRKYDIKCKVLRQLESKGHSSYRIDRTRAVVKDLHSRIRVAIHRIDHISRKIEDLRDKELQPQLEELIKGLSEMWIEMSKFHKLQYDAISVAHVSGSTRITVYTESHRQVTIRLENELSSLSSSFTKWLGALKSYLQAINGWLLKSVRVPKPSKRNKRAHPSSWRNGGPPIYIMCGVWLERIAELPTKEVVDSLKGLAAEISHFLPRQEKGLGKNFKNTHSNASDSGVLRDEVLEDWAIGFDRFRSSLVGFLGQLSNFAKSSAGMYEDLQKEIQRAKSNYDQWLNHVKAQS